MKESMSTFNFLQEIAINSSYPFLGRAAGRAIVGSINFQLINAANREIRTNINGLPETNDDQNSIDNFNQKASDERTNDEGLTNEEENREEQGFVAKEDWRIEGGLLVIIKDHITDDLAQVAGTVQMKTVNRTMPNPYEIAPSFELSFERQTTYAAPALADAAVKAEAEALGVSEEDVRRAAMNSRIAQANSLRLNKREIMSILHDLRAGTEPTDAEAAFDRLHPMTQLRLMSAADRGLWQQRDREIMNYRGGKVQNNPFAQDLQKDAGGNIKLIDGLRIKILDEVKRMSKDPDIKRAVNEAMERGSNLPQFNPRPGVTAETKTA